MFGCGCRTRSLYVGYSSRPDGGRLRAIARKDVPSVGKDIYVGNLTEGGAIIVAERAMHHAEQGLL